MLDLMNDAVEESGKMGRIEGSRKEIAVAAGYKLHPVDVECWGGGVEVVVEAVVRRRACKACRFFFERWAKLGKGDCLGGIRAGDHCEPKDVDGGRKWRQANKRSEERESRWRRMRRGRVGEQRGRGRVMA
jgi:hypothetical protein